MARFGTADVKDRVFGAAVYLFAIYDALALGIVLVRQVPALIPIYRLLQVLVTPITLIYNLFNSIIPLGFGSLIVFFALFIAVVRNEKVPYFIRFNALQSILFGIALALIGIIVTRIPGLSIFAGLAFIIATGASLYCIAQCALGRYPEIPTISAAAYSQLPR